MEGAVKISEAAKRLGVSVRTIQRWADAGKIKLLRSPTGRLYISESEIAGAIRPRWV